MAVTKVPLELRDEGLPEEYVEEVDEALTRYKLWSEENL